MEGLTGDEIAAALGVPEGTECRGRTGSRSFVPEEASEQPDVGAHAKARAQSP